MYLMIPKVVVKLKVGDVKQRNKNHSVLNVFIVVGAVIVVFVSIYLC